VYERHMGSLARFNTRTSRRRTAESAAADPRRGEIGGEAA
jgi:hypothetical protein